MLKQYIKYCILVLVAFLLTITLGVSAEAKIGKLPKGANLHHIFPREFDTPLYNYYFKSHGINIHVWCIPLDPKTHNALHYKMDYNGRWRKFIGLFPKTTGEAIFAHATALLIEGGIRGRLAPYNYTTRKPTGESFPPKDARNRILRKVAQFAKNPRTLEKIRVLSRGTVVVSSFWLAYEVYQTFSSFDDDFRSSEYVQRSMETYLEAIEIVEIEGDEAAVEKIGEAYFFLGYASFHKYIEYCTEYCKEIADRFSHQSDRYLTVSKKMLEKSVEYNESIPHSFFYLAKICKIKGQKQKAESCFLKAKILFKKENNHEFLTIIDKELEKLKKL